LRFQTGGSTASIHFVTVHARQRGPGLGANAQLKSGKILRRIRSRPTAATDLVNSVQVLI
jgi:hypothetical protein